MKVSLFPFQDKALRSIRLYSAMSLDTYSKFKLPQVVSFTAPTGAGKTIIMSAFIESVFWGDEQFPAMPNAIVVWLSDSPELNEQSKLKIDLKADKIRLDQCVTISEDSFDAESLEDGHIYFLNTQKLSKTSKLTKHSDSRQYTIWETLQNTINEKYDHLFFIIDEAHRGAKLKEAGKATTIMQKFIKGSIADGLSSMPVVIGMSATVERFNTLVADTTSTIHKVIVTPDEVRKSGLLKDKIVIKYPEDQTTNKEMAVLQAAADEWQAKCDHWYQYCYEQHYQQVYPILVVQVENGKGNKISNTDLDDCIKKIEDRINYKFAEGEVVHTFGVNTTLTINGLNVPYEEPSAINYNRKVKVVLFKESLSTGWDCPRAETMMSFKVASDSTYIAQLLGRMVRTPLQMRVQVDESLNEVHLYLPNFNANTVRDVVNSLQSTEGANIPTEIEGEELYKPKTEILTIKPIVKPVYSPPSTPLSTPTPAPETITEEIDNWLSHPVATPTVSAPIKNPLVPVANPIQVQPVAPISEIVKTRMEVMQAINSAGLIRYDVRKARVNDYLSSLFKLTRLLSQSGLYISASKEVVNDIVELIHTHCESLKNTGEYEQLEQKVLEFKMQAQVFDVFGQSVDNNAVHDLFSTTDTDIDRQFTRADILLGREGVAQAYGHKYLNLDDENEFKMDVIIYANNKDCIAALHKYAEKKYNELNDIYRIRFTKLDERFRNQYDSIVTNGDLVSKHIFTLPEFINVDIQKGGNVYENHLFVNEEGKATFKLTSWEEKVLAAESKAEDFVCWLRNPERKSWAMCIPYEMDNEYKAMYPDFIIIRKSLSNEYLFDILEPHNASLKDNLPKAKGLARYAQQNIGFTRVQMIRIVGNDIIRLDLGKTAIRNKVIAAINNDELDHIFDTDGVKS